MWKVVAGCLVWTLVHGFDVDIKLDAETILDLDAAMCEDVTTPNKIKKNIIMQNMLKLFLTLDQIYEKLQEDFDNSSNLKQIVDAIKSKGGLKILDLKQDNEKVMKAYDWDEDRATQLSRNLERACEMWRNILEVLDSHSKQ